MNVFDVIEQRRAIKHFNSSHQMTDVEISQLMSAAVLSPTSYNIQNWRFVLVQDKVLRQEIRKAARGQAQVTESSLLIVLCADLKSWKKSPERYWRNAPKEIQDTLVPMIGDYYEGNEKVQNNEAMRSCGMAAQTLMLAAKGMGYDSCPMVGFDFEKVGHIIKLPSDHIISMLVVVGKAVKLAQPRGGQLSLGEVVIQNKF